MATAGRCRPCGVVFSWQGKPLLRDALCPRCKRPLDRTAVALLKPGNGVGIVSNQHPLQAVR